MVWVGVGCGVGCLWRGGGDFVVRRGLVWLGVCEVGAGSGFQGGGGGGKTFMYVVACVQWLGPAQRADWLLGAMRDFPLKPPQRAGQLMGISAFVQWLGQTQRDDWLSGGVSRFPLQTTTTGC